MLNLKHNIHQQGIGSIDVSDGLGVGSQLQSVQQLATLKQV